MIDAGKYNKKINIISKVFDKDNDGFRTFKEIVVLSTYASVKTTKGIRLIVNDSDFEKAYTNFTIRYPIHKKITRDMIVKFREKEYIIEYLNNVNEENIELEIQCKEVSK